jgi:hypothetical protein
VAQDQRLGQVLWPWVEAVDTHVELDVLSKWELEEGHFLSS